LLSHLHPSTAFATAPDKEAEEVEHNKVATRHTAGQMRC